MQFFGPSLSHLESESSTPCLAASRRTLTSNFHPAPASTRRQLPSQDLEPRRVRACAAASNVSALATLSRQSSETAVHRPTSPPFTSSFTTGTMKTRRGVRWTCWRIAKSHVIRASAPSASDLCFHTAGLVGLGQKGFASRSSAGGIVGTSADHPGGLPADVGAHASLRCDSGTASMSIKGRKAGKG